MKRALIIYNPVSGTGAAEAAARAAEAHLSGGGFDVECLPTHGRGDATRIAREGAPGVDLIVVAGGDGSLREAIAGLRDTRDRVQLGLLPSGNANVVARELGIPLDPHEAVPVLTEGEGQPLDVGVANSELFLAMVGVGWDALAVRLLDRLRGSRLGKLCYRGWADALYALAGLVAFFARAPRLQVASDGRDLTPHFRAAIVCNLRTYGKGWAMAPDARHDDGALHFQLRKRPEFPFILWQVIAAMLGRKTPAFISRYGAGARISIEAGRAFPVQADGDFRGYFSHLHVSVEPRAVRILAPRRFQNLA